MRWPRWSRWSRPPNGTAELRRAAEEKLSAARRMTPQVRRVAARHLPVDEFAARVAQAFRRRPA